MKKGKLTVSQATVIGGILTLIGTVVTGYFYYITQTRTVALSIQATQTAEAKPTPLPTLTNAPISTPRFSSDCEMENLIFCGVPVPVFVYEKSNAVATFVSEKLIIEFYGQSGVAFHFTPPIDVKKFGFLEITGISDSDFLFLVEYKIKQGEELKIVATSTQQLMQKGSMPQVITVPISYFDLIDEIVLNFFEENRAAKFTLMALRLK